MLIKVFMDLKIKDVAELLNVSETTIRRWLVDGRIPAYRINHQYRFNRLEIEDWVLSHKLGASSNQQPHFSIPANISPVNLHGKAASSQGNKQFSLYRAIHKGGVQYNLPENNKEEIIIAATKNLSADFNLDAEIISHLLLEREALQSTGLNNGIAIPHTRDFLLNDHVDLVSVVFPERPISYGSLDGLPVHTLFFLFASDDKKHLHLLAKIAHLSSQPETRRFLQTKPPKEKLLEYVKSWESGLQVHCDSNHHSQ